jgi:spermidine synthase
LPLLLHGEPHTVLFLGLGTGISAAPAGGIPGLSAVAVELSQGAINAAANWFSPINGHITQTIDVVRDDARRFLRVTPQRYDVIIGDLFHPDLVGRSNLLSVQQFLRAKDRLERNGIFTQWLALNQFDATSLAIVLRGFRQVFPEHLLFVDGFRLALVGLKEPWPGVPDILEKLQHLSEHQRASLTGGEGVWTWLGRYWGTIPASDGPVQDDWVPQIEFRLPRARFTGEFDLSVLLEQLLPGRPSVESAAAALNIPLLYLPEFDRAFIASELAMRSWLASLRQQPSASQRLLRMAYQANPGDRWISTDLADRMLASLPQAIAQGMDKKDALKEILTVFPDHVAALKALRTVELESGNTRRAAELQERLVMLAPLDKEIRAFIH